MRLTTLWAVAPFFYDQYSTFMLIFQDLSSLSGTYSKMSEIVQLKTLHKLLSISLSSLWMLSSYKAPTVLGRIWAASASCFLFILCFPSRSDTLIFINCYTS